MKKLSLILCLLLVVCLCLPACTVAADEAGQISVATTAPSPALIKDTTPFEEKVNYVCVDEKDPYAKGVKVSLGVSIGSPPPLPVGGFKNEEERLAYIDATDAYFSVQYPLLLEEWQLSHYYIVDHLTLMGMIIVYYRDYDSFLKDLAILESLNPACLTSVFVFDMGVNMTHESDT